MSSQTSGSEPQPSAVSPQVQRVALYAVASGLTPLIPVPFLDEYALRRVREGMVRSILRERSFSPPDRTVTVLAGLHPREGSRLQQFASKTALFSLRLTWRKAYRRLATAIWVKDCVDMASVSLHHGYLLQHALERGDLDATTLATEDVPRRVHAAIDAACKELDARPVNQALRRLFAGSRLLLSELTKALESWNGAPRTPLEGEEQEVASLAERLATAMWEERGYFQSLESLYSRHFQAR
ncbi:hypothetical protein [Archangium violaceum]|uniref:Uncharacterized protein n=1 Tax=Archangium violaceum Cb vi76 TaxID=1406225 RepID=A0A084SWX1_9BACT|nr:hypothetical protein [Archangium violaceum]KFA92956.1 hypothetical protein Q664_11730 [Archangium violaceum Cb vi76]